MQKNMKARLRESWLLAPSGRGGEFTQPSLYLFLQICVGKTEELAFIVKSCVTTLYRCRVQVVAQEMDRN